MSLQDWLKSGRLKPHKPGGQQIAYLLAVADHDLADAQISELSADRRLATAYNSALQIATTALAANGYRVSREGHHYWTIQSLAFTMNIDGRTIEKLDKFRKKRNITDYEMIGNGFRAGSQRDACSGTRPSRNSGNVVAPEPSRATIGVTIASA